jgi:hypothetical protein
MAHLREAKQLLDELKALPDFTRRAIEFCRLVGKNM